MRGALLALGAALTLAVALDAQTIETKSKTRIKVKDGDEVTVTGCLRRNADPVNFILTNVTGPSGALGSYQLVVSEDNDVDDLEDYIGHRVEIRGKAVNRGHGRLETKTKTETRREGAEPRKTEAKAEVKGDLKGLPFLGVKTVKMISSVCP